MAFLDYRPNRSLYHYCSKEGFLGITQTKRLWLSELTLSNDPREIHFGLKELTDTVESLLGLVASSEHRNYLNVLTRKLVDFSKNSYLFTTCFTPDGDSLPMWQGYTPDASGLSIGFRSRAITDMPGRLQKVYYVSNSDAKVIADALRASLDVFAESRGEKDERYWIEAISFIYSKITSCKHQTWSHEKEVRLCYSQPREKVRSGWPMWVSPGGAPIDWIEPQLRQRGGESVPYIAMPFGKWLDQRHHAERAIENVFLGPRCSLKVEEVREHLLRFGFSDFAVTTSDCLMR